MIYMKKIIINGENLTIEDVVSVARDGSPVELSKKAIEKIKKSRKVVENFVSKEKIVYGITTGFGEFKNVFISKNQTRELQENLIRSHSVGVGNPLSEEIVRAAMLLRANSLAKGYSGVRVEIIETLCQMLNKKVHPVMPEKGSVGASGDLAPLSHMTLVLMGEGEAFYNGKRMSGKEAMKLAGIKPIILSAKEGLALNNGTAVMTAIGVLTLYDAENVLKCADIAAAMTLEALFGIDKAFDERIHKLRPHLGQIKSAENIRKLIKNSEILSHTHHEKVQDAYSLRCIPQVHGASRDAINYVRKILETEINSATDNPLIFTNPPRALSGGNFHGQPIAIAMDLLGIALAEIADISERRIARILDPHLNEGLPAFLITKDKGGLNNGYMMAQYTAAALVSENKVLAHPASVDSIPTSANQEDHVSMGTIAARKAREILKNVENVIAIELLCAAQGMDFRLPLKGGQGTRIAHKYIRKYIPHLDKDRILYPEINKVYELIHSGELVKEVENKIGKLN
jgi:histidine ammonia-lyase